MRNIIKQILKEEREQYITMYSGISLDKWEEIWKDKKLKDNLTNVTNDIDFALDYSYDFKTGKYDDVVVEISNIPLDAFVSYREDDYEDDEDFHSMVDMDDNNKLQTIKYNTLFLVNLYPYIDTIETKLIVKQDLDYGA